MKSILLIFKTLLLTYVFSLQSAELSTFEGGNSLYEKIKSGNLFDKGLALGYVVGTYDAYVQEQYWDKQNHYICMNSKVTKGQLLDVVEKYLNENPSLRHQTAAGLVLNALSISFPCN
jgi:hypothetical protein